VKPAITLIELLIVIGLVGIIAGVGWPNLQSWNCKQQLRNDFENFNLYMSKMQAEATTRSRTTLVQVVIPAGAVSLRPFLVDTKTCTGARQSLQTQIPILTLSTATKVAGDQTQCFYSDGGADANSYQFTKTCSGKRYLYKTQIFGATGLIEKLQYNFTNKSWEDL
jgi:Tfp pilus assembly protein FimT